MQRRNPNSTAALLQKANSQLRGEKIEKPEDELNDYINSLTQKTSQQKKAVNFEDLGDSISISSDLEDVKFQTKPTVAPSTGSKFLKKKPASIDEEDDEAGKPANKFLKKPQTSATSPSPAPSAQARYGQKAGGQGSAGVPGRQSAGSRPGYSALDKASALTGKIKERATTRKAFTIDSDSDESLAAAMKLARSSGELVSESLTTESVKVGRDGGKFMKKATPSPAPTPTPAPASGPPLTSTSKRGQTAGKVKEQEVKTRKASPFTLKSSLKYSTDVVLTSEEESLAEFVGGLPSSSGDSMEKPYKGRAGRHSSPPMRSKSGRSASPSPHVREPVRGGNRSQSPQAKPPVIRRTPSPSPRTNGGSRSPGLRRRSPSPKLMRSFSDDSNVAESIKSEIAEDFDIGVNIIMDLEDLAPAGNDALPSLQEAEVSRDKPSGTSHEHKSRTKERGSRKSQKSCEKSEKSSKKESNSPFKASKSPSAQKEKEKSLFKASQNDSPFKAGSGKNKSPFAAGESNSPFKASNNKENVSPFKSSADRESPFKSSAERESPFKAKTESSKKKASSSPFKSRSNVDKDDSDRSSPFKAGSKSQSKNKASKSKKKSKKKSSKAKEATSDMFSSFGIQTIEDLLGPSVKESEYESVLSEVDEVRTEVSDDEIKTEKPSMYSYSQRFEDTATEIETEAEPSRPAATYTDEFDSISEKIGVPSDHGRSTSVSEVRTRYSGDETMNDYTEFSESDTETVTQTRSRTPDSEDESRSRTETYSYTTYTEDYTRSLMTRTDRTPAPRRGMTNTEAQTAFDGLHYGWDPYTSGLAFQGVPRGLEFVDPTPIATHVVSADALEAMTSYSPSMLALQDMMKAQYELTKEFLETQTRLYSDFSRNIEPTYRYTTLQDTKQYIKKNKKKKLTFKEALKLVDLETARQKR